MTFKSAFNKALEKKGMSNRELAGIIGVHENTISKYKGGKSTPNYKTAQKIEGALDLKEGTLSQYIHVAERSSDSYHSEREAKILAAWNRGKNSPEKVAEITGYSLKIVGKYLPLGVEGERLK